MQRKCPTTQPERDACCGSQGTLTSHPVWSPYAEWDLSDDHDVVNNCYSYAFNDIVSLQDRDEKLQPGELSGGKYESETCESIVSHFMRDYPERKIRRSFLEEEIECDRYKIGLAIASDPDNFDYHFYRQDLDGLWSHKPGENDVINVDASHKNMTDPQNSDRDYTKYITEEDDEEYNYDIFCGYFSLQTDSHNTLDIPARVRVIEVDEVKDTIDNSHVIYGISMLLFVSALVVASRI